MLDNVKSATEDEKVGIKIIRDALTWPIRQLATNAGYEPAVVQKKVEDNNNPNFGFNADTGQYQDLMKNGIIDPAKVVRSSLENGSSVARVLLSSACLIATKPEKKKGAHAGHGHGGMDDEDMGDMDM